MTTKEKVIDNYCKAIKSGDTDKMVQSYVKALQTAPTCLEIYKLFKRRFFNKFHVQLSSEDLEKLINASQDALKFMNPSQGTYIFLHRIMADIYRKQGRVTEMIECYQNAAYHKTLKAKPAFVKRYWDIGKRKEPNFLIIGFAKCGTTALYNYILKHPQILPALEKETNYLSRLFSLQLVSEKDCRLSDIDREAYFSHFPPIPETDSFLTGEASHSYITTPGVEKLVFNCFPNAKLIIILRSPIKRTISQYYYLSKSSLLEKHKNSIDKDINKYIDIIDEAENLDRTQLLKIKGFLVPSLYYYFLEPWMKIFPREQFLILKNEDLSANPAMVMKQVFEFLGLPEHKINQFPRKNAGSYSSEIDEKLISRLADFFRPHNQKLEDYLGINLDWE